MRFAVLLLVACSNNYPSFGSEGSGPRAFGPDSGPERFCGVVPGAVCSNNGEEITRCLCGTFESQIGRLICCREGHATVETCQQADEAVDCQGRRLLPPRDAAAD